MLLQGQRQNPSIATVAKLAQALGVPIEELLEEEDGVVTH
jgi:transcriptional regulator with XRE-family HTH domain